MRVGNFDTSNVSQEDFQRYASKQINDIINILNKGILFADNFDAVLLTIPFTAANTDVSSTHALNRVPIGYYALNLSAVMVLYNGSLAFTENQITLKSSAVGTALVLIF